jgi:transposase
MDMEKNETPIRIIGLDCHPDTFTAAIVRGSTPASAVVEKTFDQVSNDRLESWVKKNTIEQDLLVLEASGNGFQIARILRKLNRTAQVLESCHLGKLKEGHANNDKISAVRIARAYLAGTAKKVWVPDEKTQQRRDWYHAHQKAVKRTTQMRNRVLSYLSDNGVRLPKGTRLASDATAAAEQIRQTRPWSEQQWQVIEILLSDLHHAEEQRAKWRALIAREVSSDPVLLSLMRLCGVRVVIAFAIGAVIGDIQRFARPKALVKYVGLNPAFDHSGQGKWQGGIGGHGRKDLRSLLVEAAQSVLRSKSPLAKWGKKLLARKGVLTLVVAAMARKITVAIWYLLKGKWTALEEVDTQLSLKVGKLISTIQVPRTERKKLKEHLGDMLTKGRTYTLDPTKTM